MPLKPSHIHIPPPPSLTPDFRVLYTDASHRGLVGRVRALFDSVLLPRITSSSQIYTTYARFLFAQGDLAGSLQAHMKAYRCDVVTNEDVATDRAAFERAAEKVVETVDVLRNLGGKEGSDGEPVMKDWNSQARSVLRSFLGRTKESFGEEATWEKLQEELKELRSG